MMFEIKKPGKKIREICKALGNDYSIKVFDFENVIYRDLGNGYDFEVSKLDNRKKSFDATLYIWNNKNNTIAEEIFNIQSVEELNATLDKYAEKYLSVSA